MDSTTEAVTKTVVNKNTVKIALDEYNDLVRKAARPVVQNVSVLRMTNAQAAKSQRVWGISLAVIGTVVAGVGVGLAASGKKVFE
jgi:hypothetical protein